MAGRGRSQAQLGRHKLVSGRGADHPTGLDICIGASALPLQRQAPRLERRAWAGCRCYGISILVSVPVPSGITTGLGLDGGMKNSIVYERSA